MQNKFHQKSEQGFTLIEVIITMFLIIVTLMIYQVTSNAVALNKANRHKEVALRIADQKLQSLRTTAFDSIPASGAFSDSMLSTIPDGAGTITVSDINDQTKDIIVTITWTNPQTTNTQQLSLETYVTEGGIGQ